ncbi:hypothetical protein D3C87_1542410 [compost metagenome]
MAARTSQPNLRQQEQTRSAIKTTQLVKRLQCFALGEKDDAGNDVELDSSKLKAIEVLLRKTLPDLSTVSLEGGDENNPIKTITEIRLVGG